MIFMSLTFHFRFTLLALRYSPIYDKLDLAQERCSSDGMGRSRKRLLH